MVWQAVWLQRFRSSMKICKKCGAELPLTSFYTHKQMADGHLSFCKDCVRTRVLAHRSLNLEMIRAYDRSRGYRVYDRNKERARQLVYNAVRRGELQKQPCWCGAPGEAHHHDYSRPLDVDWLCKTHHGMEHRG